MRILWIAFIAFSMISFGCWIGNWADNINLREKLEKLEANIEYMQSEHELAMSTANNALKAREEVYEYQKQKLDTLDKVLGNNPDFCRVPVPDDIRLLWQGNNNVQKNSVPASK